jgi:hypothetical protein
VSREHRSVTDHLFIVWAASTGLGSADVEQDLKTQDLYKGFSQLLKRSTTRSTVNFRSVRAFRAAAMTVWCEVGAVA